jgi:hypothetical protein
VPVVPGDEELVLLAVVCNVGGTQFVVWFVHGCYSCIIVVIVRVTQANVMLTRRWVFLPHLNESSCHCPQM